MTSIEKKQKKFNARLHAAQEGAWVAKIRLEREMIAKWKFEAEKRELDLKIELLKAQLHAAQNSNGECFSILTKGSKPLITIFLIFFCY